MTDTIAAIATASGNGGVGIIRLSGAEAKAIALELTQRQDLKPRYAHFTPFYEEDQHVLDSGICLYFPNPASYTGEDIVEIQAHGGAVVLDMLLRRVLALGARLANAGEFTERAFLNDKLDLAQAEAIADLIESSTEQSVRSAQKSMQGVFSEQINGLVDELTKLRMYVEAAIDFVDEEIDFLSDGVVENKIITLAEQIETIQNTAQQGRLLRDGMTVVLAGKPNAGKSSLLNALAGHEAAIVTDIAGTTRDVLKECIQIDGMPLHIIDTAGLRDSDNVIEKEGIRRAHVELKKADCILLLVDAREGKPDHELLNSLPSRIPLITVYNKIDLVDQEAHSKQTPTGCEIYLSLKPENGLDLLKKKLKQNMGYTAASDTVFIARRRHIEALTRAHQSVENALMQLQTTVAGELIAEDLRQAQNSLSEITGKFSSDDLLGKIFSSFCIGK
ncbi:MAG: tRNA uridine-5-carboxymethylaminomethyl(34) synthesis GTPase MnmE [Methylococcaceae bacterium]|nr:tRNA uridine-5-carboxymethylaminomethyl(34) synthesis GTPase MnmE [Methylococcaceae bacterium]